MPARSQKKTVEQAPFIRRLKRSPAIIGVLILFHNIFSAEIIIISRSIDMGLRGLVFVLCIAPFHRKRGTVPIYREKGWGWGRNYNLSPSTQKI